MSHEILYPIAGFIMLVIVLALPAWVRYAQKKRNQSLRLIRTLETAEMIIQQGDFRNGNTHNGQDEGDVMAERYHDQIKEVIKEAREEYGM
jgi:hypothetical protein